MVKIEKGWREKERRGGAGRERERERERKGALVSLYIRVSIPS
jgi:hypothetical protein